MAAYLIILTTMLATHCNAESLIHPAQLGMSVPGSNTSLSGAYKELFASLSGSSSLHTVSDEGALLLLAALWSELVFLHRLTGDAEIGRAGHQGSARGSSLPQLCDPFVSLSPAVEKIRLQNRLKTALLSWNATFAATVSEDIVALYYYCNMISACPQILGLPSLAGYPSTNNAATFDSIDAVIQMPAISDESVELAVLVLNHASASDGSPVRVSIWLPVIVFHAALAVWAHDQAAQTGRKRQSRTVFSFIQVLQSLPWPCCKEMVGTLQKCSGI